eukprot:363132-Chlamydomonas_euryale.AAC.26
MCGTAHQLCASTQIHPPTPQTRHNPGPVRPQKSMLPPEWHVGKHPASAPRSVYTDTPALATDAS